MSAIIRLLPTIRLLLIVSALLLLSRVYPALAAAKLADGTYSIVYTVNQADSDSVSIANDYFEKPAKLIVSGGEIYAQIRMNHSAWITVFKTPGNGAYADAPVVGKDEETDTREVRFKVEDLDKPVLPKIHVTVKSIDYDHDYTIRLLFDTGSIKPLQPAEAAPAQTAPQKQSEPAQGQAPASIAKTDTGTKAPAVSAAAKSQSPAVNPKTGDTAPIALLIGFMAVSAAIFARYVKNK